MRLLSTSVAGLLFAGCLLPTSSRGQDARFLLGPEVPPENLGLSSDYVLAPRGDARGTFIVATRAARIAEDETGTRFGFQYIGLSDDVGDRLASLSMTLSINPPAADLEKLRAYVRGQLDGELIPSDVRVKVDFFHEDSSGSLKRVQVVPEAQADQNGVALPAGSGIPLILDLAFLGSGENVREVLNGQRKAGFLVDAAYRYSILARDETSTLKLDARELNQDFYRAGELEVEVVEQLAEKRIFDAPFAAQIMSTLYDKLPEQQLLATESRGIVQLGWEAAAVRTAFEELSFERGGGTTYALTELEIGAVYQFPDLCALYPDKILDLETLEQGCDGLDE